MRALLVSIDTDDDDVMGRVAGLIGEAIVDKGLPDDVSIAIEATSTRPAPVGFGDDPTPGYEDSRWRIAGKLIGGHVHVKIRCGRAGSRALCGTIVLREDEWPWFVQHWQHCDVTLDDVPMRW